MDEGAVYNGKTVDLREKMTEISKGMEAVKEYIGIVSMPRFQQVLDIRSVPKAQTLSNYLSKAKSTPPPFEKTTFHDPFFIAYSSGTTGTPKCIVHSIGGALVSSVKELKLVRISELLILHSPFAKRCLYIGSYAFASSPKTERIYFICPKLSKLGKS